MRALLVGVAILAAATSAAAQSLVLTTENYPPFNFLKDDGTVAGMSTEIVREIMRRSAIDAKIELMPWARAYERALGTPGHCVYSTTMTPDRRPLFKWVEPIVSNNWVLFVAADSPAKPPTLDAVKGKRIGGYVDDATAIWLKDQGHVVDEAPRDDLNPAKLAAGRIDYWASGERLAPIMAKEAGVAIKPVLTIRRSVLGLACNQAVPAPLIDALKAALAAARADGTIGRIEDRYR